MTKMQELQARLLELEQENEALKKQVAELTAKSAKAPKASKGKQQAEALLALFKEKGEVSKEDLVKINEKYPSDAIYHARTILGLQIVTVKEKGKPPIYRLIAEPAPAPNGNGNGNGNGGGQ